MQANCTSLFIATALCAAAPVALAADSIEVVWVAPEQYADAGHTAADREQAMRTLGDHLKTLGTRLPHGQSLRLEVLDVDLAGEVMHRGWHPVRVLRNGTDWPRMTMRYTLLAEGRTLASGQATLADMHYLFNRRDGALAYEKRMLDTWFRHTFAAN